MQHVPSVLSDPAKATLQELETMEDKATKVINDESEDLPVEDLKEPFLMFEMSGSGSTIVCIILLGC